jgi:hypothetical protein
MCWECNWPQEDWRKQEVINPIQKEIQEGTTNFVLCDCGREADKLILNDDATLGICNECIKNEKEKK